MSRMARVVGVAVVIPTWVRLALSLSLRGCSGVLFLLPLPLPENIISNTNDFVIIRDQVRGWQVCALNGFAELGPYTKMVAQLALLFCVACLERLGGGKCIAHRRCGRSQVLCLDAVHFPNRYLVMPHRDGCRAWPQGIEHTED